MQAQEPLVKRIWNIYFWGHYTDYVTRNFRFLRRRRMKVRCHVFSAARSRSIIAEHGGGADDAAYDALHA